MELEEALKLVKTLKADIDKVKADNEAMQAKNKDLLNETKQAKQKAKEEADLLAKSEADKALKDGNFEQLLDSSKKETAAALEREAKALETIENMKVETATALHSGEVSAFATSFKPLSEHALGDLSLRLKSRTKVVDGVMKVLDKDGNLTVSSTEDLKTEMLASGEISHLIQGNQSSGGDSPGGDNTPAKQTMTSTQKIEAGLSKL